MTHYLTSHAQAVIEQTRRFLDPDKLFEINVAQWRTAMESERIPDYIDRDEVLLAIGIELGHIQVSMVQTRRDLERANRAHGWAS